MSDASMSQMIVELRPGECLQLQKGLVNVELVHKSGRVARLYVTAPRGVTIEKVQHKSQQGSLQAWPDSRS